jgi:MFS family permease
MPVYDGESVNARQSFFSRGILFVKRQDRDWKITVVRTSFERLAYQIVFPYLSLYIVALGATVTQLGLVNSIGMIAAGVLAPLTGWVIDRSGPKRIYLLGIGLLGISYLTYGVAQSWLLTIIAMAAYWLGYSASVHSCATVCGNCLTNEDRATGMTICETVAAGLLGMAGPMIGAWLVTLFGGVNTSGIRPLFFLSLIITLISFGIILTQLSNKNWRKARTTQSNLFHDIHQVLKEGRYLKRWLVIAAIGNIPLAMVFPFSQVFAHEMKGAGQFILGAMVTGSALTSIALSIPLGRLADKVGRKKVLFISIPFFWVSNLVLVWAPNSVFLVVAGILQGFFYIVSPIAMAMERELVPPEQMGRWLGITRGFRMLLNACMALLCGLIWDKVGPQYVFLSFIALDLVVRVPLLIIMPETLNLRVGGQA